MNRTIDKLRKKIDEIDNAVAALILERVTIAYEIIKIKKSESIGVEDNLRENTITERLGDHNPQIGELLKDIYGRIFSWVKNR